MLGVYAHVGGGGGGGGGGGEKCCLVCWANNRILSVTVCFVNLSCTYLWVMCVMVSIILCRTTLTHLYA